MGALGLLYASNLIETPDSGFGCINFSEHIYDMSIIF